MEYAVLLYGDEKEWERADAEARTTTFTDHAEFARVLAERGHTITGGAELRSTATAKTVRGTSDQIAITDGLFAETSEQLGGARSPLPSASSRCSSSTRAQSQRPDVTQRSRKSLTSAGV